MERDLQINRQTHIDIYTYEQTDRQTDRQRTESDRQMNRHTEIDI